MTARKCQLALAAFILFLPSVPQRAMCRDCRHTLPGWLRPKIPQILLYWIVAALLFDMCDGSPVIDAHCIAAASSSFHEHHTHPLVPLFVQHSTWSP